MKPSLSKAFTTSRRFVLLRHRDINGVSGTGIVADGVEFPGGEVVVRWRGKSPSINIYQSLKSVDAVHSHKGATEIIMIDDWPEKIQ